MHAVPTWAAPLIGSRQRTSLSARAMEAGTTVKASTSKALRQGRWTEPKSSWRPTDRSRWTWPGFIPGRRAKGASSTTLERTCLHDSREKKRRRNHARLAGADPWDVRMRAAACATSATAVVLHDELRPGSRNELRTAWRPEGVDASSTPHLDRSRVQPSPASQPGSFDGPVLSDRAASHEDSGKGSAGQPSQEGSSPVWQTTGDTDDKRRKLPGLGRAGPGRGAGGNGVSSARGKILRTESGWSLIPAWRTIAGAFGADPMSSLGSGVLRLASNWVFDFLRVAA